MKPDVVSSRRRIMAGLVASLWVLSTPAALAAPSGGDGFVRHDFRWHLGGKTIEYGYCEEGNCTPAVGMVEVDAEVQLDGKRKTRVVLVRIKVVQGPQVRADMHVYCHEHGGILSTDCGERHYDTEVFTNSDSWDFAAKRQGNRPFKFEQADDYQLTFGLWKPIGGDYIENPYYYQTTWINCPKDDRSCRFREKDGTLPPRRLADVDERKGLRDLLERPRWNGLRFRYIDWIKGPEETMPWDVSHTRSGAWRVRFDTLWATS